MSTDTGRDNGRPHSMARNTRSQKSSGSEVSFDSPWFYVYLVRKHDEPADCFRIKRARTPYSDVPREIELIADDILERPGFGTAIGDITLRHQGYFVVLMADSEEKLSDATFTLEDKKTPYRSFTDGAFMATVGKNPDLSAFYCVNRMQSADGSPLGEAQAQGFNVHLQHSFRSKRNGTGPRSHEDAGTNLGPPKV
jgi:hypothetical protein